MTQRIEGETAERARGGVAKSVSSQGVGKFVDGERNDKGNKPEKTCHI